MAPKILDFQLKIANLLPVTAFSGPPFERKEGKYVGEHFASDHRRGLYWHEELVETSALELGLPPGRGTRDHSVDSVA
jgi:hypothetical protein